MYFENTGIEGTVIDLKLLDDIMARHNMTRAGQWDYERATYDKKYVIPEGTFYLRVFGYTEHGDIGAHDAEMILLKPVIGKHYYPFGIEYGEDEYFPEYLLRDCERSLAAIHEELIAFKQNA